MKRVRVYDNDDLDATWRRISRHDWATKNSQLDPRMRRLVAVRQRRAGNLAAVLCDCED